MSIPFVDINSWEFILLVILAIALIGPKRLPEYAAKLRTWIRQARDMADGAKSQLKEQMGPEFEDVNWRQYDPRQYDPRRIVREALFDDPNADVGAELGLTEAAPTPHGATAASPVAAGAGVGAQPGVAPSVGSVSGGVGVGAEPVGATHQPHVPRSFVDNTYHPDRATPFDAEAT